MPPLRTHAAEQPFLGPKVAFVQKPRGAIGFEDLEAFVAVVGEPQDGGGVGVLREGQHVQQILHRFADLEIARKRLPGFAVFVRIAGLLLALGQAQTLGVALDVGQNALHLGQRLLTT